MLSAPLLIPVLFLRTDLLETPQARPGEENSSTPDLLLTGPPLGSQMRGKMIAVVATQDRESLVPKGGYRAAAGMPPRKSKAAKPVPKDIVADARAANMNRWNTCSPS